MQTAQTLFDGYNPNDVINPEGSTNKLLVRLPGPDKPLICKLIPDLRSGQKNVAYYPITLFSHMTVPGGDPSKDKRFHPCQKSLGQQVSPEGDAYFEALSKIRELERDGKKDTPEYKKLEAITKLFYPKQAGWLTFVRPDSSIIEAVRVPKDLLNKLFGRPATKFKPAVPSLVQEMRTKGYSPFDLRNPQGWIVMYRTGEGLATTYHAEVWEREVPVEYQGRRITAREPVSANVNPVILDGSKTTLADIPDFRAYEKKFAFTLEEAKEFVASAGTKVPARFLKDGPREDDPPALSNDPFDDGVSPDDIPL